MQLYHNMANREFPLLSFQQFRGVKGYVTDSLLGRADFITEIHIGVNFSIPKYTR